MSARVLSLVAWMSVLASVSAFLACGDDTSRPAVAATPGDASADVGSAPNDASAADVRVEADARPPFVPDDEPVTCEAGPCVTSLAAGDHHFCAVFSDGKLSCWGDDTRGALGTNVPNVRQVSAAAATTCAVDAAGDVWCWGANDRGQLGATPPAADEDPHATPTKVAIGSAATRVDVGHGSVCARLASGTVMCWGDDRMQQLARTDGGAMPAEPATASLGADVVRVAAGTNTLLALAQNGELRSVGALAGDDGVLGGRVASVSPTPHAEALLLSGRVSSFAVSSPTEGRPPENQIPGSPPPPPNAHACAVIGGSLYCWGKSERGGTCSGLPDLVLTLPTLAPLKSAGWAQQVSAGGETTCVRFTTGDVQCCGENDRGQLATGTTGQFSPVLGPAFALEDHVVQVAVAKRSACALTKDGRVLCWGANDHGELGQGSVDTDAHPTPIERRFP